MSLEKLGGKASFCAVNVTSRESIEDLLAVAIKQTGRANILVNAAGVNAGTSFLDATDADWDRILTINLKAVFQACQIFARHMVAAGGGVDRQHRQRHVALCRCRGCSPMRPRKLAC